jgi:phage tail sheath protein FI
MNEVSGGVRPLEIASTSTAAFVGLAEMGPDNATPVTSWTEYQRLYGGFLPADSYLAQSVFQYFNNGGRQCYIVRVLRSGATTASVTMANRASTPVEGIVFSAKNKGAWGNSLVLQIEDGTANPGKEFKVSVRRQSDPDVVPTDFNVDTLPLEVFDDLSTDPDSPRFVEDVLARGSYLIDAKMRPANKFQKGLHRGDVNPTTPLGDKLDLQVNVDGDGFQLVTLADAGTADLAGVATAIQKAVTGLTKKRLSTDAKAFTGFTCVVEPSAGADPKRLVLRSGTEKATSSVIVAAAPAHDASVLLKLGPGRGVSEDGDAVRRPANTDEVQVGDAERSSVVLDVDPGDDGDPGDALTVTDFQAAFHELDTVTDASLLAVPGEGSTDVMNQGMAYCAGRPLSDMFFIGETLRADQSPDGAVAFRNGLTSPNSYGALYYPWIKASDPTGRSQDAVLLPPSGYIAGLYARIDAARGVWKAPAGTEATLNGVVGLGRDLTDIEHGNLNPRGICALRRFAGTGVVAFGARTVSDSGSEWKYVPVRRMAIMLRTSIYYGIQWAVFEPNDEPLWSQLRLNVSSFMTTLFRQGAFQGSSTSEAFYVKCDRDTTPQPDIDLGIVNLEVGFAPLKPAEFVVVTISQKAGQASS